MYNHDEFDRFFQFDCLLLHVDMKRSNKKTISKKIYKIYISMRLKEHIMIN